jgi:hypothetical protein
MGAENILPIDGRAIQLGGQDYVLKFTMRTIAELAKKYGSVNDVFKNFTPLAEGDITFESLETLAYLLSAGLKKNHPEVTPDYVMDSFDLSDINDITEDLLAALMDVLSVAGESDKKKVKKAKA